MDLKGKVAVVTGGNGGLGQRICHALAKEGCHIAVVYAQSKDQAEGVAKDLQRHQVNAATFQCDVTKRDHVTRLVDDVVKRFGRLDILINDAAYNRAIAFPDLDSLTYEEWTKIIDINLTGPMLLTKAVAPVMKKQGAGRIVNISSVAGLGPTGSSIAYAVSKAGLIHLTKCMAVALAPEVLVNCVAPGLLEGTRATANLRPEVIETGRKAALLGVAADSGTAVIINRHFAQGELFPRVRGKALPAWAAEFDCTSWAQFFLKYILGHPAVTCVIPGTEKVEYLRLNLGAAQGRLPDAALRKRIEQEFDAL